jgi:hypothetical protein
MIGSTMETLFDILVDFLILSTRVDMEGSMVMMMMMMVGASVLCG